MRYFLQKEKLGECSAAERDDDVGLHGEPSMNTPQKALKVEVGQVAKHESVADPGA